MDRTNSGEQSASARAAEQQDVPLSDADWFSCSSSFSSVLSRSSSCPSLLRQYAMSSFSVAAQSFSVAAPSVAFTFTSSSSTAVILVFTLSMSDVPDEAMFC